MLEREAMALLVSTRGIGYGMRQQALRMAGSALNVLREPERYVIALGARGVQAVHRRVESAQEALDRIYGMGAQIVAMGEAEYPEILTKIERPPHALFVLGRRDLRYELPIAVVGTRSATEYGLWHARKIALGLTAGGACIVSGLAVGIDAASHTAAVDAGGPTVAVLGGGLDRFYPEANRALMERIIATGGSVISEFPMGVHPSRHTFLQRNRTIVGLSKGVLVIEGAQRSGAMSTAHWALEEGRELYALPANVDRPTAELPNRLIAEGAHPATCADDILYSIDRIVLPVGRRAKREQAKALAGAQGESGEAGAREPDRARRERIKEEETPERAEKTRPARAKKAREKAANAPGEPHAEKQAPKAEAQTPKAEAQTLGALGERERAVLQALEGGELDFDTLCARTGLGADVLGGMVVMLEMEGYIRILPGLRYVRA